MIFSIFGSAIVFSHSIDIGMPPTDTTAMSALRGVIQRGRARGTLAAALARHPSPLPITAPHV